MNLGSGSSDGFLRFSCGFPRSALRLEGPERCIPAPCGETLPWAPSAKQDVTGGAQTGTCGSWRPSGDPSGMALAVTCIQHRLEPPASPFSTRLHLDIAAGSSQTEVLGRFFGFATICLVRWPLSLVGTQPCSCRGAEGAGVLEQTSGCGVMPCLQRRKPWGREMARLEQSSSGGASSWPPHWPSVGSCPFDEPSGALDARLPFSFWL